MDVKIAGGFDCVNYVQEAGPFGGTKADCEGPSAVVGAFVDMTAQQKCPRQSCGVDLSTVLSRTNVAPVASQ